MQDGLKSSPSRIVRTSSPGKYRGMGGEIRPYTAEEIKQKFISLEDGMRYSNLQDRIMQTVNT